MLSEINIDNGLLILENVPPGTEVGIDYHSWYIGPTFRGIANIPPGFHFIFISSVDKYNEKSPRSGFFVFLKGGEVIVKIYDNENEELKNSEGNDEQMQQYVDDIKDISKYLAPYPEKECQKWSSLTNCISQDLLERIQPICGKVDFLTTVPMETGGKQKKSIRNVDSRVEDVIDDNTIIRFSKLECDLPDGLSPQEISKHNIDSSYFLERFIRSVPNGEVDVIGELQFAFITFLIGQVYDSFEHWKLLVTMLTNCNDCLSSKNSLFMRFIDIIGIQMEEIPEDFFIDIVAQHNFLLKTFQSFFQNFEQPDGITGQLLKKVSSLKHKLNVHFQWDFDEEDEEDMPVVVEL